MRANDTNFFWATPSVIDHLRSFYSRTRRSLPFCFVEDTCGQSPQSWRGLLINSCSPSPGTNGFTDMEIASEIAFHNAGINNLF